MIEPVRGRIEKIFYVSILMEKYAVVHEVVNGKLFIVLDRERSDEWLRIDEYQMGFLDQFHSEFVANHGEIVDIGMSVSRGENAHVVLALTDRGWWYILYDVDQEGFWEVVEEMFVNKESD